MYLKEWKNNDKEINDILSKRNSQFGFNKKKDDNKNSLNENELFKTKISDISISYLDPYPKQNNL